MDSKVDELAGLPPIPRSSLHDEVVTRLRDMIIEGRLAAGTRIHELKLCEALGVSRTPLREALKVLASEGLIELTPSRGATVRRLTPADVLDMLRVLGALEALAGELACAAASDSEIDEVRDLHAAMMRKYAKHDRLEYFKLNQRIHSTIVRLAKNRTLESLHDSLQARIKRIRFIGNEVEGQWRDAVAEHEEMIDALGSRDGARLARVLRRHMDNTWKRVNAIGALAGG